MKTTIIALAALLTLFYAADAVLTSLAGPSVHELNPLVSSPGPLAWLLKGVGVLAIWLGAILLRDDSRYAAVLACFLAIYVAVDAYQVVRLA